MRLAIAEHFKVDSSSLHLTHPTFFSRLTAKEASTPHDEYWHLHVDKETYPTFHYTSLVYLTDHGTDFQGGEFVFVDAHDKINRYELYSKGKMPPLTTSNSSGPFNPASVVSPPSPPASRTSTWWSGSPRAPDTPSPWDSPAIQSTNLYIFASDAMTTLPLIL